LSALCTCAGVSLHACSALRPLCALKPLETSSAWRTLSAFARWTLNPRAWPTLRPRHTALSLLSRSEYQFTGATLHPRHTPTSRSGWPLNPPARSPL
jgi:hypothetical protein